MQQHFVADLEAIRKRAREHIETGAVTAGYKGDSKAVVEVLQETLATEIVCMLRYKRHYFMAQGIAAEGVAQEFQEHAAEEAAHADKIAARIVQLGGAPNFNPEGLAERSSSEYVEGVDLRDMIKEDLVAERVAIDTYREIIAFVGEDDPTTRRMLEDILAVEEEHAEDMASLLGQMDNGKKNGKGSEL